MNIIIENLKKKIKEDKRKLIIYNIFDRIISLTITFLNLIVISIAIYILARLIKLNQSGERSSVFFIILAFVICTIVSFFLNIVLIVYKENTRLALYKKVKNTLIYLVVKYNNKIIDEKELAQLSQILWDKVNLKQKIVITHLIKNSLESGAK
ncbi:hypothetical protein [Mycoplasmopsis gallinarum]|uniref:Uncharacterized protein n=1 Tax=Mycoplasmopsis gallinarum TaxID=29557 RepID=A0A168RIG5_9BACT|nr:hypothetical protein [Mycoplasmopsis gallinarum]OAB49015.1 hypothetical protein MGALLINA_02350 [Mycoplasmopsis gallinarum]